LFNADCLLIYCHTYLFVTQFFFVPHIESSLRGEQKKKIFNANGSVGKLNQEAQG